MLALERVRHNPDSETTRWSIPDRNAYQMSAWRAFHADTLDAEIFAAALLDRNSTVGYARIAFIQKDAVHGWGKTLGNPTIYLSANAPVIQGGPQADQSRARVRNSRG